MFDHIGLKVSDLQASISFFRSALAPLGIELVSSGEGYAGFGPPGEPGLWLYANSGDTGPGVHLAFSAPDRTAVQRFHAVGLAAGARDNGEPGLRAEYSPNYYAAFLIDREGNNVEAVCFN
jgi:catechol 2,3-dioxygenase-like lactoylglutathione lyase family enzyme